MPESKVLSMLGLSRRAGKLSMGHDMVQQSLIKRKAKLLIFCVDASQRLIKEFEFLIDKEKIDVPVFVTKFKMDDIHFSLGYKAGVMTVDDVNFSKRIKELLEQEDMVYDN